jgi:hypothetical protein
MVARRWFIGGSVNGDGPVEAKRWLSVAPTVFGRWLDGNPIVGE